MKKVALAVASLLVVSAPLFTNAAPAVCPSLSRSMSRGSRGSDVTTLQQFLISQNLLASNSTTGYFGALTERAVQTWQSTHGIVSSGTPSTTGYGAVGPKTRQALASCGASGTSIQSSGSSSSHSGSPAYTAVDPDTNAILASDPATSDHKQWRKNPTDVLVVAVQNYADEGGPEGYIPKNPRLTGVIAEVLKGKSHSVGEAITIPLYCLKGANGATGGPNTSCESYAAAEYIEVWLPYYGNFPEALILNTSPPRSTQ